ncbi:hypothetical protein K0M31_001044, partial [Melipona bicolor]
SEFEPAPKGMSEPTTLYILITPVLKANKVLGRIAAFVRLAQPRERAIGIPRNQCTANDGLALTEG